MARDYGRRPVRRQKSSASKQLLWMLASFLSGYLTATVFDFTSLSGWVNNNILAKPKEGKPKTQIAVKEPELPKPKFEFYTLLAKDGTTPSSAPSTRIAPTLPSKSVSAATVGSAGVVSMTKQPKTVAATQNKAMPPVANTTRELYQVQIASFKNRQDADHMKAELTLKGFDVTVVSVSQSQGNWFRVIVGPFNSRSAAEKARLSLAQTEHIKGMIRRMGA